MPRSRSSRLVPAAHRPCRSVSAGIRYWPVSQRPRSTSAQRRLQNGRSSSTGGLAADRTATGQIVWAHVMLRLNDPPRCRQGGVRPQNQGTPGAPRKIRQRFGIRLQAPPRSRARHAAPAAAAVAPRPPPRSAAAPPAPRRADRPAARAAADARGPHDLGQPKRGEAEQARPQRVVRQRRVQRRARATRRRAAVSPAKSTRIAPDRLRSRICRASAGSTARFDRQMRGRLALPPGHRAAGVHVDRHQRRRGMDVQSRASGQVNVRLRQRLDLLLDRRHRRPGATTLHASPSDGLQPGGQRGVVDQHGQRPADGPRRQIARTSAPGPAP